MAKFTTRSSGYDTAEVDKYIYSLENKLQEQKDRIFDQKQKLDQISGSSKGELMESLVKSVERAKQIEISSQNIYELETKRLQLFYGKMESMIEEITQTGDCREVKRKLTTLISEFKDVLSQNVEIQNRAIRDMEYTDPVQRLLNKMSSTNVKLKETEIVSRANTEAEIGLIQNTINKKQEENVQARKEENRNVKETNQQAAASAKQTSSISKQAAQKSVYQEEVHKNTLDARKIVEEANAKLNSYRGERTPWGTVPESSEQSTKQQSKETQTTKVSNVRQESIDEIYSGIKKDIEPVTHIENKTGQTIRVDENTIITSNGVVRERLKGVEVGGAVVGNKVSNAHVPNQNNDDVVISQTKSDVYVTSKSEDDAISQKETITTFKSFAAAPETTTQVNKFSRQSKLLVDETPDKIAIDKMVATKVDDNDTEVESESSVINKKTGQLIQKSNSSTRGVSGAAPLIHHTEVVTSPSESTTTKYVKNEKETQRMLNTDERVSKKVEGMLDGDKVSGTNFESIMFKKTDVNKANSVVNANLSYPTPNASGFNLKDAVNPKDDLDEIMKSFDFYDDDPKNKKKKK